MNIKNLIGALILLTLAIIMLANQSCNGAGSSTATKDSVVHALYRYGTVDNDSTVHYEGQIVPKNDTFKVKK